MALKKERRIATTPDQSRRLVELGLDRSTSDCFWHDDVLHFGNCNGMNYPDVYPAWSGDALFGLLPCGTTFLYNSRLGIHIEFVAKIGQSGNIHYEGENRAKSALDSLFGLVEWLLDHGHIHMLEGGFQD